MSIILASAGRDELTPLTQSVDVRKGRALARGQTEVLSQWLFLLDANIACVGEGTKKIGLFVAVKSSFKTFEVVIWDISRTFPFARYRSSDIVNSVLM